MTRDQRRSDRFEIARLAFVRSSRDATTIGGVLGNISQNGAAVRFMVPIDDLATVMPDGLKVDVVIDEFPALTGRVARTAPKRIAVDFDLDSTAQRDLLAHILSVTEADYETDLSDD